MKLLSFLVLFATLSTSIVANKPVINIDATPASGAGLFDDGNPDNLLIAINRQIKVMKRSNLAGKVRVGSFEGTLNDIYLGVLKLKDITTNWSNCLKAQDLSKEQCLKNFTTSLETSFDFYRPLSEKGKAHYTAYFSPTYKASTQRKDSYQYGIYSAPKDSTLAKKYTRNEIVFDRKLEPASKALFFLDSPFDLFLLHVEGGGRVIDEATGKSYFLSYETTNRKKFAFIGPYMKKKGYISNGSVRAQRNFLNDNKELWREIYDQTPNYVYMKITKSEPLGMENIPLTSNRSLAFDRSKFARKGMIVFVNVKKPTRVNGEVKLTEHRRIYLDQDTGGAIKGSARADLYFGFGDEARFAADNVNHYGDMLLAILK